MVLMLRWWIDMQIERIPEIALTHADEVEIAQLLNRGFQEDFGGRSYHQQRHHMRLIVRGHGVIIGHMAICYRAVRLGEALITICGLAEVVTAPELRGKGLATAMLNDAITFAKSTSASFFVLFGDRPIYAGHGFVKQRNSLTQVVLGYAKTGDIKTGLVADLMVLPLGDQSWDKDAHLDLLGHKF